MRYSKISKVSYFEGGDVTSVGKEGNDGPNDPTHLYPIRKYVKSGATLLDVGCGQGWTYLAIKEAGLDIKYKGVDFLEKQIAYCQARRPGAEWDVQDTTCLAEEDKSWDVAYSRGVIEYAPTFAIGLNELCRVARKFVIVWFWAGTTDEEKSRGKRFIINNTLLPDWGNTYSWKDIKQTVKDQESDGWKILEFTTDPIEGLNPTWDLLVLGRKG